MVEAGGAGRHHRGVLVPSLPLRQRQRGDRPGLVLLAEVAGVDQSPAMRAGHEAHRSPGNGDFAERHPGGDHPFQPVEELPVLPVLVKADTGARVAADRLVQQLGMPHMQPPRPQQVRRPAPDRGVGDHREQVLVADVGVVDLDQAGGRGARRHAAVLRLTSAAVVSGDHPVHPAAGRRHLGGGQEHRPLQKSLGAKQLAVGLGCPLQVAPGLAVVDHAHTQEYPAALSTGRIPACRYSSSTAKKRARLSSQSWNPRRRALLWLRISSQVRSRVASA